MLETAVNSQFQFDKNLILWLTYTSSDKNGQVWYITSDRMRLQYQLWKGSKKTKWESDNPLSLYDKIR
jgi:hypothetical protein